MYKTSTAVGFLFIFRISLQVRPCPLYASTEQEVQLMLRNPARRHIIRREEKYRQLVGRRTAVSYAEGVNVSAAAQSYITATAQRYQTENF